MEPLPVHVKLVPLSVSFAVAFFALVLARTAGSVDLPVSVTASATPQNVAVPAPERTPVTSSEVTVSAQRATIAAAEEMSAENVLRGGSAAVPVDPLIEPASVPLFVLPLSFSFGPDALASVTATWPFFTTCLPVTGTTSMPTVSVPVSRPLPAIVSSSVPWTVVVPERTEHGNVPARQYGASGTSNCTGVSLASARTPADQSVATKPNNASSLIAARTDTSSTRAVCGVDRCDPKHQLAFGRRAVTSRRACRSARRSSTPPRGRRCPAAVP